MLKMCSIRLMNAKNVIKVQDQRGTGRKKHYPVDRDIFVKSIQPDVEKLFS